MAEFAMCLVGMSLHSVAHSWLWCKLTDTMDSALIQILVLLLSSFAFAFIFIPVNSPDCSSDLLMLSLLTLT